jgi:hypothetical protein
MDLFTVGSNGVPAGGSVDEIMAGAAVHGVGSSVLFQVDEVVSKPAVDRVCPRPPLRPSCAPGEDHIGAGGGVDLV